MIHMIRKLLLKDVEQRLVMIEIVLEALIDTLDKDNIISRGQVQVEILKKGIDDE